MGSNCLPSADNNVPEAVRADPPASWDGAAAVRRLWRRCRPLEGTLADAYLRARGLDDCRFPALRFHPALAYRDDAGWRRFPALVAAVSGPDGILEGVQRTWLHPERPAKAPVAQPRKALGRVHGHAVRFAAPGGPGTTLLVGEGIETVLSLVAARLLIAADRDAAGRRAATGLKARAMAQGLAAVVLVPAHGDFNDDLAALGPRALAARLAPLLGPRAGP